MMIKSAAFSYGKILLLISFFLTTAIVPAQNSGGLDMRAEKAFIESEISSLFDLVLADKISLNEVHNKLFPLKQSTELPVSKAGILYFQGSLELYLGTEERAEIYLGEAFSLLECLLKNDDLDSTYYQLFSSVISQLTLIRGFGFQLKWGTRVKKYTKKAIDLDAYNHQARLGLALFYYFAPPIGGGSDKKAFEELDKLYNESIEDKNIEYLVEIWSAVIMYEEGNEEMGEEYLRKAEKLYPRNGWVTGLLKSYDITL